LSEGRKRKEFESARIFNRRGSRGFTQKKGGPSEASVMGDYRIGPAKGVGEGGKAKGVSRSIEKTEGGWARRSAWGGKRAREGVVVGDLRGSSSFLCLGGKKSDKEGT